MYRTGFICIFCRSRLFFLLTEKLWTYNEFQVSNFWLPDRIPPVYARVAYTYTKYPSSLPTLKQDVWLFHHQDREILQLVPELVAFKF